MKDFPSVSMENVEYYKEGEFWFPYFNRLEENKTGLPASCMIHDVTLRDGEQTPGITFLEDERVRIAEMLDEIGVYRIEGGMPAVSEVQYNALKRMANAGLKAKVFGFARAHEKDVGLVISAGCEGIVVEHTVNPIFCKYGYDLTPATTVQRIGSALKAAKDAGLYATFMGWDWFRSPIEWTKWLVENLLDMVKFDGLTIVDTYGNATPEAVYSVVSSFHKWFPDLALEFHGHNDAGMGVSSCMAALKAGATTIHTAMNSLGERTGNVATEQFMVAAQLYYGVDTGTKLENIYPVALTISKFAKTPINPGQPIIGARAYQMENGVGTHLAVTLGKTCGIGPGAFNPCVVGKPGGVEVLLGKNSGGHAITIVLNKLGLTATDEQKKELTEMVKKEGILTKDIVTEEQFLTMYKRVVG